MKNIILFICVLFPLICHAKTNDWQLIHAHYYPQDKEEKHIQKIYLDKASIKTSDGDIREFTTINTFPNGYLNPSNKVEKRKMNMGHSLSSALMLRDGLIAGILILKVKHLVKLIKYGRLFLRKYQLSRMW